jgi:hypothetical protein
MAAAVAMICGARGVVAAIGLAAALAAVIMFARPPQSLGPSMPQEHLLAKSDISAPMVDQRFDPLGPIVVKPVVVQRPITQQEQAPAAVPTLPLGLRISKTFAKVGNICVRYGLRRTATVRNNRKYWHCTSGG